MSAKGVASVELLAHLYLNDQAPTRRSYRIECGTVSKFQCTVDVSELRINMAAGNISNGYFKGGTLWLYFCDGILQLQGKRFRVSEC